MANFDDYKQQKVSIIMAFCEYDTYQEYVHSYGLL